MALVAATWIADGKMSLRRLRGVHVVVGVHGRAEPLGGQGREHLVGVHVRARCPSRSGRRRSGTRSSQSPRGHLGRLLRRWRRPRRRVSTPSSALTRADGGLDPGQRGDECALDRLPGDREVLHRALGLGPPLGRRPGPAPRPSSRARSGTPALRSQRLLHGRHGRRLPSAYETPPATLRFVRAGAMWATQRPTNRPNPACVIGSVDGPRRRSRGERGVDVRTVGGGTRGGVGSPGAGRLQQRRPGVSGAADLSGAFLARAVTGSWAVTGRPGAERHRRGDRVDEREGEPVEGVVECRRALVRGGDRRRTRRTRAGALDDPRRRSSQFDRAFDDGRAAAPIGTAGWGEPSVRAAGRSAGAGRRDGISAELVGDDLPSAAPGRPATDSHRSIASAPTPAGG